MQKNRRNVKGHRRVYIQLLRLIPLALVIILCLFSYQIFMAKNRANLLQHNKNYIKDVAKQKADNIERLLKDGVGTVEMLSYLYSLQENTQKADMNILLRLQKNTDFDYLMYADASGLAEVGMVRGYMGRSRAMDCADKVYYEKAMNNQSGISCVQETFYDTTETYLAFYSPVLQENGEVKGLFVGFIGESHVQNTLLSEFYDYPGEGYLCNREGEILMSSDGNLYGEKLSEYTPFFGSLKEVETKKGGRFFDCLCVSDYNKGMGTCAEFSDYGKSKDYYGI